MQRLAMSFSILLVLEMFGSILTPSEAVVYYVTPTEPPSPAACPQGRPCHTLDHYFSHKEEYFDSSKINVTMLLLGGEHVLSRNHTEHMNMRSCLCKGYGHIIKDLEMFEMIGLEPAYNVIILIFTKILLMNITISQITNLKFHPAVLASTNPNQWPALCLVGCKDTSQSSEMTAPLDDVIFITVVNGSIFKGVEVQQVIELRPTINFRTALENSWFELSSFYGVTADVLYQLKNNYTRELKVTNCTFRSSPLLLGYDFTNIQIFNSTSKLIYFNTMIHKCNMDINGNFYFLNAQDWQPLATVLFSNVKITGDVTFADSEFSSISAVSSAITLSGIISFLNNTGINGGAMTLYSSTLNIAPNTSVYFYNNTATETGGAIYVDYDGHQFPSPYYLLCFYRLLDYEADSNWYNIIFCNNSATMGGDHVYGALMHSSNCYIALPSQDPSCCAQKYFYYEPKSMSSVSSDPTRVCICKNGSQQCNDIHLDINVYPGEIFTLPIVIVGADFGTTFGSVHAVFKNPTAAVQLKPSSQYIQGIRQISDGICSEVNYTVYSKNTHEILLLTTKHETWRLAKQCNDSYNFDNKLCSSCLANDYASVPLLITPLLLNITLFPCPAGFQLRGDPPGCECHPLLTMSNVKCQLINHTGYHIWIGPLWLHINASNLDVYIAQYCPFDYCKSNKKTVTFESDPSAQCAFNHAGQLCGGCQNDSYALAVGSSYCIHCSNNNLALLVFFAAAGILLVAIIGIFNLTVTQGMINGLIFYANIAWTYKRILFPQQIESNVALVVVRTLMAWLNLDFGIHTCFVKGLNALHKTWPQYFFILYIWGIGIAIIVAASHSMKLTNILGNRPVPILVTLFLLSYTKLLQIIIASVGFTQINVFSAKNYTLTVWSLDGTYIYCGYPHILLFIAALLIFLTLWLPYTLMIFSVQWLRKISHLNLLKWVTRLNPVFDAHLAPLKDKHHYWFGVLLIVRGILLVILTLTYTVYPEINYIMLLITASVLLVYSNYHRVYRNRLVQINENFFLFLLVVIGATGILEQQVRRIVTYVSVGVGLLAFSGITIGSRFCYGQRGESEREFVPNETKRMQQQISDSGLSRDDVLDEIEPLLSDTEQPTPY